MWLYAILRDKSDDKEYEVFVRIHEEVKVNDAPATKIDISSLKTEIMNTQSKLTSTIYFTAMAQLFMIAFCFIFLMIALINR